MTANESGDTLWYPRVKGGWAVFEIYWRSSRQWRHGDCHPRLNFWQLLQRLVTAACECRAWCYFFPGAHVSRLRGRQERSLSEAGQRSHQPSRTPLLPVVTSPQAMMNRIAYQRVRESLQRGHQVMVFVHARKDTVRTAEVMCAGSFQGWKAFAADF